MNGRLVRCLGVVVCGAAVVSACRVWYEVLPLAGGAASGSSGAAGAPNAMGGAPVGTGAVPIAEGGGGNAGGAPDVGSGGAGAAGAPDVPPRCSVPVSPITDYCTSVPRLTEAVALDGELDCGLMPIDVVPQGWVYDPALLDATARFAAAWDEGGVYFFLDVRDASPVLAEAVDPLWMGDSVELYLDTNGSFENPPGYDAVGTRQISIGRTHSDGSGLRGQLHAESVTGFPIAWTPDRVTVTSTDEGYVVEAYIPGSVLDVPTWTLSAGDPIGLDAGVNVSCPDAQTVCTQGHRLGQFFYHLSPDPAGEPYRNVAGFCTPILVQ